MDYELPDYDEDLNPDDDYDDDDFDPNVCPECGSDLDREGYCQNLECGYSLFGDDNEGNDIPF